MTDGDDSNHSDTDTEENWDQRWSQLTQRLIARKQMTETTTTAAAAAAETSVSSNAESYNWNASYQHLNDLVCKTPLGSLLMKKELDRARNQWHSRDYQYENTAQIVQRALCSRTPANYLPKSTDKKYTRTPLK